MKDKKSKPVPMFDKQLFESTDVYAKKNKDYVKNVFSKKVK